VQCRRIAEHVLLKLFLLTTATMAQAAQEKEKVLVFILW
jgi:hypothetical protein